ncbi:MAG: exosortase C-terminal domain/associated protein EpsI [Planctomycetota bacterium]
MNKQKKFYLLSIVAIVLILASGWVYQKLDLHIDKLSNVKVYPEIPFTQFPMEFGPWKGKHVEISETVLQVAHNDDYLSRLYVDADRRFHASVYVAYTAEPRRMLGHRPRRCYTGSGWSHQETRSDQITTAGGRDIPVLVHRFHWPGMDYQEIAVVNFYVVNGALTSDHRSFSGLRFRRPKITDGRAEYVAQVQVSSVSEAAAKALAQELSDEILRHLPKAPSEQ